MRDVALRRKEPISEYCKVCKVMFITLHSVVFVCKIVARMLVAMEGHFGILGRKSTVLL